MRGGILHSSRGSVKVRAMRTLVVCILLLMIGDLGAQERSGPLHLPAGYEPVFPQAPPLAYFDMYERDMDAQQCAQFRASLPQIDAWAWRATPCAPAPRTTVRAIHDGMVQNTAACNKLKAAGVSVDHIDVCKPPPPPNPAAVYLRETMQAANDCRKDGGDIMACFIEASPARCKQSAIDFIGKAPSGRRSWILCVRSCASAGLWSSTVGDCRR